MYRVIWRRESASLGAFESANVKSPLPEADVLAGLPLRGAAEPVFPAPPVVLRAASASLATKDPRLDLAAYGHAFVDNRVAAEELVARLRALDDIAYADVQGRLGVPVRLGRKPGAQLMSALPKTATPDLGAGQHYLLPAPHGIGARAMWTVDGGTGRRIRIVDIEYGWNFLHEDLRDMAGGVVYGPNTVGDHGTAVLGIYSADHNGIGVQGIAPDALASAASADWDGWNGKWNAAAAIYATAKQLRPGDIILLEMHGPGPNSTGSGQDGFVPVEYWEAEWAAIRYATDNGIHVVEAAGNGGEDLDANVYGDLFDRSVRDSGAILVGAGGSGVSSQARSPLPFSNYGARVDVQGWGEDIVTCGGHSAWYHDLQWHADPNRCYTGQFGGTSGASPMVVGCVAVLEGIRRAYGVGALSPGDMRLLLSATGTPQQGAGGHVGPLPNLHEALQQMPWPSSAPAGLVIPPHP